MRIAIVSDAWTPQVNGVVRTLNMMRKELRAMGHRVYMVTPDRFLSVPCPTYPEIRLALGAGARLNAMFERFEPEAIHIATEGPLGFAARRWCLARNIPFTTAYHTNFPEYIQLRTGIPEDWLYTVVRRFHAPSAGVMVATPTVRDQLRDRGFINLRPWTRGVDTDLFRPFDSDILADLPRPIYLNVGRVAVEKNIEAFLKMELPGSKVVVGDGPALEELSAKYPDVHFVGKKTGDELAAYYAACDVFVFPSLTDTFGLVLLEAMAAGKPVAAYPVQGPLDVLGQNGRGVKSGFDAQVAGVDEDLGKAIESASNCRAEDCRAYAMTYSWRACAEQFLRNLRALGEPEAFDAADVA